MYGWIGLKIVTVIGARPQFIKAAVVSRSLRERSGKIQELILHTGQHFDANMSDIFFEELSIPKPDINLNIGGGTHGQNTGRMLERIEDALIEHQPDCVLVYGDTDSTLAGALAAKKLNIPIAHVEAGLRSFENKMPEETNRLLTDHMSCLLFTPTKLASKNLIREGISPENIELIGDVMLDATLHYQSLAESQSKILDVMNLKRGDYVLATVHRQENVDNRTRLQAIVNGLAHSQSEVIWPLHPRTALRIAQFELEIPGNLRFIEPVGYLDMLMLEKHSRLIATDSGGVQKEAYFVNVPCLVLRDQTEWVELVENGAAILVGANEDGIASNINSHVKEDNWVSEIYGQGDAAAQVVSTLVRRIQCK